MLSGCLPRVHKTRPITLTVLCNFLKFLTSPIPFPTNQVFIFQAELHQGCLSTYHSTNLNITQHQMKSEFTFGYVYIKMMGGGFLY